MALLRLTGFGGAWPIRDPRALPDNAAVDATNVRVEGGAYLKGIRSPTAVKTISGTTNSVYRLPLAGANTFANSFWMEFADIDTDVVRAPIVNDQYERIYWASPSTGLRYAPRATIIGGTNPSGFIVGVRAPVGAPLLNIVGGTITTPKVTREYYVTFISPFGEESQPSGIVEAEGYADSDWILTNIPQPPVAGSYAGVSLIRIYRTVTGTSGLATFSKVADLGTGTTFYTDHFADVTVSGNTEAESTIWAVPPSTLQGLIALPNGIFVSWADNNVYFSENYRPHAWPAEYTITVEDKIVGLGVFGNTCVVCTTGRPVMITGTTAAAMSMTKIDNPLPCLSRRSIVSAPEGVYYASQYGLVLVGPNGVGVATDQFISREQWSTDYAPSTIRAFYLSGMYTAATVGAMEGFRFKPANPSEAGVTKLDLPVTVKNWNVEPWTGKAWMIAGTTLYEWEVPGTTAYSYAWKSKEFLYPIPANFSVFQAYFDDTTGSPLHLRIWANLRDGANGAVTKYLAYDNDIVASGKEIRFPGGFKSDVWQLEFSGSATLQEFLIGTSVTDLRSAS